MYNVDRKMRFSACRILFYPPKLGGGLEHLKREPNLQSLIELGWRSKDMYLRAVDFERWRYPI